MPAAVKTAIIQHAPVFLNIEQSLKKAEELVMEAAAHEAEIIVFPETWLTGYCVWLDRSSKAALWDYPPAKDLFQVLVQNSVSLHDKYFNRLLSIAQNAGAYIVMGMHEQNRGTLYNTLLYIDKNGKDFTLHRKLIPTYTERLIWGRGDGSTLNVLDTEFGVIGGLICWEHWMPLARAAMHSLHETIHIAQWPAVRDLHQVASRHYAFEGQCFVIAAGCYLRRSDILEGFASLGLSDNEGLKILEAIPGKKTDVILNGGSAVIGPDSNYIAGPVFDREDIIYADIQPELITQGHLVLDTDGHYSRPDIFTLEVNDQPQVNVNFSSNKQDETEK